MKTDRRTIYWDIFKSWKKTDIPVIIRCDDFTTYRERLYAGLFDICERERIPLDVAVIPALLEKYAVKDLLSYKFLRFHQHGYRHAGRSGIPPIEFDARVPARQLREKLAHGRSILLDIFEDKFSPVYTPPWNRYGWNTVQALNALQFKILSAGERCPYNSLRQVKYVGANVDFISCYAAPVQHAAFNEIMARIISAVETSGYAGLLLHPNKMRPAQLAVFARVIAFLKGTRTCSFNTILERGMA